MEIKKVDLKILIKEFLTASNRVLRANYNTYASELSKFVRFLETYEIIYDYIRACGEPEYDVGKEFDAVSRSYGSCIFSLGTTTENEVANVYAVIKYMAEKNVSGRSSVFYGYSSSKQYQEMVNSFGNEFIRILITHIENYLTRIAYQVGLDEKTTIQLSINDSNLNNTQVNIANEGSTITSTQQFSVIEKLDELLNNLLIESKALNADNVEIVNDCVETISTLKNEKPAKGVIRMALTALKGIGGTAGFIAAVTEIVQFVQPYI